LIDFIKKYSLVLLELGKVRITMFVALSTSFGYILHSGRIEWGMIIPTIGVFLLASGSSCINHIQEMKSDALMDRTKGRPLPSGRVDLLTAILVAANLVIGGGLILYYGSNLTAMNLGWIAVLWYNAFYTPLKKKYAMAVVPGALIGAIPPMIGWVASGGDLLDFRILLIAFCFFIWQIPHFWLLVLIYNKDYEKAGFPTLTNIYSSLQISRITFVWIAALAVSCIAIPIMNHSTHPYTVALLMLLGVWLVWSTRDILSSYLEKMIFRKAFIRINIYVLIVLILISLDKLIVINF
jgi:heme o synthase